MVYALDRSGGLMMRYIYNHSNSTINVKLRQTINGTNCDLVLLGSSTCHHHYVTTLIEDSLSLCAYNAGVRGGSNIYFNYALVKLMMRNNSLKFIVYDLIPGDFVQESNSYDKLIPLSPYYGISESLDSLFDEAQLGWKYDVSHLYRYNGKFTTSVAGIFLPLDTTGKGYQPKFGILYNVKPKIKEKTSCMVDNNKILYLQKLEHFCNEKGIMLVFAVSPTFHYWPANEYSEIKKFAKKNNIKFIDYSNNSIFVGKNNLFYDEMHLNDEGAHIYSSMIAHDLKSIITQ